jgi:superfamily II DNA/RNA helicase
MRTLDNTDDVDHRYMMFSATFPKEARQLARERLEDGYIRIRIGRTGSTHNFITQNVRVLLLPAMWQTDKFVIADHLCG